MRRENLGAGAMALALLAAAACLAIPFRAEALRRLDAGSVSWDAALHALSGLDLFDDLRLFHPLDALFDLLSLHWWGPTFAVVLAPSYALFGRTLGAATVPSFAAFLLAAPAAFLAARAAAGRLPAFETAALAALAGAFVLRAPMLLEASAWIMLESLGGLLSIAALGLFAARENVRARRAAFALGAALFLLKVHFGLFVLVTLGVAAWRQEGPDSRARALSALRGAVPERGAAALAAACVLLVSGRLALEARGGDALARRLPSVSNVAWGAFVVAIALAVAGRRRAAGVWAALPSALRDFAVFGCGPVAAWCLDPANVRGWYRQLFQHTEAAFRPVGQLAAYLSFLREDYAIAALPFALVLVGLVLALALPGSASRRTLAAFAVWPVLLMSLNPYPAEARFLGSVAPALFAAAAAGLVALAGRLPRTGGRVLLLAVLGALAASLAAREKAWRSEAEARATYRYAAGDAGRRAVTEALAAGQAHGAVRIPEPPDPPGWPTARLAVRLARPDLRPSDVSVVSGDPP